MSLFTDLQVGLHTNIPIFIHGEPGVGKTATTKKLAQRLDWHCEVFLANLHEPTSVTGYPFVKDGDVVTSTPQLIASLQKHKNSILFIDELPTAPRATQNVLLRLVHERKVDNYELPDGCRVIAAGNFVDVAGNILLSAAMANRFLHIVHKPTVDEWIAADSETNDSMIDIPGDWMGHVNQYKSTVYTFIEKYPSYFSSYPESIDKPEDYAFPTARSLSSLPRVLALCSSNLDLSRRMCAGLVGHEVSKKLADFIKSLNSGMTFKNIDIDKFAFPEDESQVMILVKAAAMYAEQKEYGEKAVKLFNLGFKAGYKPLVMRNAKLLAQNLVKHMATSDIIAKLPFVGQVLQR